MTKENIQKGNKGFETNIKALIKRNLTAKKILFSFILANVIYILMLTVTIPDVMRFSGGMDILDMMPIGYSTEYVNTLLDTLGTDGRNAYLFHQLPLDMIYPFLFGISSCLILAYFFDKLGKLNSSLFYLCFIPLFSALLDYGENIGIITMLTTYPENPMLLTRISCVFSILKSLFITVYFFVLIVTLIGFGISKLPRK